jgi:hypothetical protein
LGGKGYRITEMVTPYRRNPNGARMVGSRP